MIASAAVAGGMVRRQRKIVESFREAGATSPERAASASALGVDEGMAFRLLRRHAILVEAGERLYLDEARWEAHRARRRRLAIFIPLAVVLAAVGTLWIVLA